MVNRKVEKMNRGNLLMMTQADSGTKTDTSMSDKYLSLSTLLGLNIFWKFFPTTPHNHTAKSGGKQSKTAIIAAPSALRIFNFGLLL
jgi:hypothetical protein